MIFSIYFFKVINFVVPDPRIYSWIPSSAANTDAVYPDGIKTPSAIGWSTFFITYNPVFNAQEVYYEILLIVLFETDSFLMILY